MTSKRITVRRQELYEEAWQTPLWRLAPKYGISDVGLKKICKKLEIPTPPRGYWMKLKAGEKLERPRLPPLKYGIAETHEIVLHDGQRESKSSPEMLKQDLPPELKSAKPIRVSKTLRNPHPLVIQTERVLSKAEPDKYGVLRPWRREYLDIRVSPTSLKRALRIMDALIKGIEERGFSISNRVNSRFPETHLTIFDESIRFSLSEKTRQIAHVPTKKEVEEQKRYYWNTPPKWDYVPTGMLSLNIDRYSASNFRKRWSEGPKTRLEDLLNSFLLGAVGVAMEIKERRRVREEEQRRREEERRILEEERKRREIEKQRLRDLESQAERWAKSEQLRAYIRAVEKEAAAQEDIDVLRNRLQEWVTWANEHADDLDPTKKLSMLRESRSLGTDSRPSEEDERV
jgi:hypothetical protein